MLAIGVLKTTRFWKVLGGMVFGLLGLWVCWFRLYSAGGGIVPTGGTPVEQDFDRFVVAVSDAELGVQMSRGLHACN